MDNILLPKITRLHLLALAKDPPHALILAGPHGLGKKTIAMHWALMLTKPAFVTLIEPDEKNSISIDVVRSLYAHTRSKQTERQVIIIDHAEALGIEAQNAFLKLLEEPRPDVIFVLNVPNEEAVLPTITSRVQLILLHKMPQQELLPLLPSDITEDERAKLLFIADGRPATLQRLLQDKQFYAKQVSLMQQAKKLLSASPYQRLAAITAMTKDKTDLIFILESLAYMLQLHIARQPTADLIAFADALNECLLRLSRNANPRTQLTWLFSAYNLV